MKRVQFFVTTGSEVSFPRGGNRADKEILVVAESAMSERAPRAGVESETWVLGGKLRLLQPTDGYRTAIDPLFLAAACPARVGERVLDAGCGVGAAALALATRVPGVNVEGIEIQQDYAELARRNGAINGIGWLAHHGDMAETPLFVRAHPYDHVITNPPYYEAGAGPPSRLLGRDLANRETMPLAQWIDLCLKRLKSRGVFTIIHRAERLDAIIAALSGRAGDIRVLPLWPRDGAPAKRVLVRAVKDARGAFKLLPGLALHDGPAGQDAAPFSTGAQAVLDGIEALDFSP